MCGIAGQIHLSGKPVCHNVLKVMNDAISHRGPDGEGVWVDKNIGLAHRRLAIIDLSENAHQPMSSDDHRYILTYNGEIYNFKEIRRELENKGHVFRSSSDTEVVLKSIIEWGTDAFIRFNGMFALAFWDKQTRRLILARDRYGIKPLYYAHQDHTFSFASEQKAILAQSEFDKQINLEAMLEYFTFQNIFTNQTLVNKVNIIEAGHFAILDEGTGAFSVSKYWDYHFKEPDIEIEEDEYIEELDRLFQQAVTRQLLSDVELGCYLSGGMDSGSIAAIASKTFPNIKSFTCGFDLSSASGVELGFDERAKAEAMSAIFKTEHYEMVLKAGDMERCLPNLSYHLEEPRVGQSYPNYYVAKLTSKFVKVVLSGAGGDELFGGYPWRYYRGANAKNFEEFIDEYYAFWQRLISNSMLSQCFAPVWSDVKHLQTRDIFRDVFLQHENKLQTPEDYINHSLYFEAKTFLHGLFVVEDKLSMAHGLETRVPFMDNDLVDFAMNCPVKLKLNNLSNVTRIDENTAGNKTKKYFQKTNDGKQILRNMMKSYIPKNVTEREKQGFSSPDSSWFKGESIDFVRSKLLNKNASIYEILDYNSIAKLIGQHLDGKENRRLLIWSLLNVEEWLEQF